MALREVKPVEELAWVRAKGGWSFHGVTGRRHPQAMDKAAERYDRGEAAVGEVIRRFDTTTNDYVYFIVE